MLIILPHIDMKIQLTTGVKSGRRIGQILNLIFLFKII